MRSKVSDSEADLIFRARPEKLLCGAGVVDARADIACNLKVFIVSSFLDLL